MARREPLVKAGRRLLGKANALNPDRKSERTCGGESLRHVLGRRPTVEGEEVMRRSWSFR